MFWRSCNDYICFFFSSRSRHTRYIGDWSSDVCSSDLPISGFIFGSRRTNVIPMVFESFGWQHGVFLGAAMSTETTAAITGQVGVVRRDPMAMIPFCGYNMGSYFAHWLAMGPRLVNPPKFFRVNWFRRDAEGRFLWPGYGDNTRILKWMVDRIHGSSQTVMNPL